MGRFYGICFLIFNILMTASARDHKCTTSTFIFNNQSHVSCELKNIKFVGLEAFTIETNRTEVLKAISRDIPEKSNVNGSISSESENIIDANEIDVDGQVLQVKFRSSNIAVVPNEIFHKFKSLLIFDASDSQVKSLSSLTFNNAAHLLMIFLHDNQLTSISSHVFVHTKLLEVLDLSNNKISHVDKLAFTSLEKLKRLDLSNNRIKTIEDFTFQPLTSLKWILIENNQISLIASDCFTAENADLKGIFLKNNAINSISPYVLDNLPSLRFLELSGNKCTGKSFKNHAIMENAAIKFELHGCHQNHRKLKLASDQKHEISHKVKSVVSSFEQCLADIADVMTTIDSTESQLQAALNYFFPKN